MLDEIMIGQIALLLVIIMMTVMLSKSTHFDKLVKCKKTSGSEDI